MTTVALPAWASYADASAVAHFEWFCRTHLTQSIDEWAGLPLGLEGWQLDFMGEALAVDAEGFPFWSTCVLVVPRKNGKTVMLSGYGLYHLLHHEGMPEVLMVASSDKQAGRLFDSACLFVKRNKLLLDRLHLREYVGQAARKDSLGALHRLATDDSTLHGWNPSLVIVDELHAFTTPKRVKAWGVLNTGGGARRHRQAFSISTAGEAQDRHTSPLGLLLDRNEDFGECERPHEGLTISRNFKARTLVYNYSAPTTDPTDVAAMKLANPASWITPEYLAEQAASPELSPAQVLQLHGCVWADAAGVWIPAPEWEGCRAEFPGEPAAGVPVWVGIDVGLVHDSTAVSLAWLDGGTSHVSTHVWAAERDAVAHEYVPGGRMDLEIIERYVLGLARRLNVQAVAYDPAFFERSASELSKAGLNVVDVPQGSGAMAQAYQRFYADVREGRLRHPGDPVLTDHVTNTAAELTDRGWKVSKLKAHRRIDATVATAMAHWFAANSVSPYEGRGLVVIG